MLEKLLAAQNQSWARGDQKSIEDLLAQFEHPQLNADAMLNLICNEVSLRESSGSRPSLAEYQRRFPHLAEELQVQWEIDAMLSSQAGSDSENGDTATLPRDSSSQAEPKDTPASELRFAGRYEIRGEIGRGAMGIVYEAYDPRLKRILALKRLKAGNDADPSELQRMSAEAEVIAQLNHPNIVQLFDVGTDQGTPFFVMEYCHGGTLADLIRGKALDTPTAVKLLIEIASGVAAAHAVGIVHRDLKPANVMLDSRYSLRPKVTDFGLAKRLGFDSHATATGSLIGSPAYMPPEQAIGAVREIGPAADVYSLGAVLYECLTGRPPFGGSSMADTLDQVRNAEPVSVRQLEPRVPLDLETIVHKCLRKNPLQRYANATELAEDLRRYVHREPILARRESWLETGVRMLRRYPLASSLAVTTALLLLLITAGSLFVAQRGNALLREARLGQAEALVGRARGTRLSRRAGQRFESLAAIRKAVEIGRNLKLPNSWFDPLRDEAIAALMLPDGYVDRWTTEPDTAYLGDFSDDHKLCAISYQNLKYVVIRNLDNQQELGRISKTSGKTQVQFVGDSLLFMKDWDGACELWNVASAPYQRVWRVESGKNTHSFSHDRQLLAILDSQWMRVLETHSGRELSRFPSNPYMRDAQVAFHPTQPLLACWAYLNSFVELRNWQTGQTLQKLQPAEGVPSDDECYSGADWTPDGQRFFLVNGHCQAQYWYRFDEASQQLVLSETNRPAAALQNAGMVLRFNQTGDRILTRGWNASLLEIFDPSVNSSMFTGGNALLLGGGHVPIMPRVDAQEEYFAFGHRLDAENQLGLMRVALAREAKLIWKSVICPLGRVIDPTNRFVLAADKDLMAIVNASTGLPLLKKSLKDFAIHCYCFDQAGCFLINGQTGCYRWPYNVTSSSPITLELGVPERLHLPYGGVVMSCSDDGKTLAGGVYNGYGTQEYAGFWIKKADEPAALKVVAGVTGDACSVSPDGHYVAGNTDITNVWDCRADFQRVTQYTGGYYPRFSQDGKQLAAGKSLTDTSTWQAKQVSFDGIPYDMSRDASLTLVTRGDGRTGLALTSTGKTLALFEGHDPLLYPCFTADGTAFVCFNNHGILRVDLRRMRQALAAEGLDWNAPAFPPVADLASDLGPIERVTMPSGLEAIDSMDELADYVDEQAVRHVELAQDDPFAVFSAAIVHIERHEYQRALSLLDHAAELLPNSLTVRQWRAYLLAVMHDYPRAISNADWVLKRFDVPDLRVLRAEWLIQAERYDEAIEACTRVIKEESHLFRYVYALRATAYQKLDKEELAQQDLNEFTQRTQVDAVTLNMVCEPMSGPDIALRMPAIALATTRRIQSLKTDLPPEVLHAMTKSLYVNDLFEEASQLLEQALTAKDQSYQKPNLILLAMAQYRLGAVDKARALMAQAEALETHAYFDFRMRRSLKILQAEAAHVLSLHFLSGQGSDEKLNDKQ